MLALGGNEVGPRTDLEIIVSFVILVFLAIYNSFIFGEMTILIRMCTRKSVDFQSEIDTANTAMSNIDLDEETREEVREYLKQTQNSYYE